MNRGLRPCGANIPGPEIDPLPMSLELLAQLEASLRASQKALLARDLFGIEQGAREQAERHRIFQELWAGNHDRHKGALRQFELTAKLRAAAARVLALGRVQALLLDRAQRSLKTTANLLSGPGASYHSTSHDSLGIGHGTSAATVRIVSPARSKVACQA